MAKQHDLYPLAGAAAAELGRSHSPVFAITSQALVHKWTVAPHSDQVHSSTSSLWAFDKVPATQSAAAHFYDMGAISIFDVNAYRHDWARHFQQIPLMDEMPDRELDRPLFAARMGERYPHPELRHEK